MQPFIAITQRRVKTFISVYTALILFSSTEARSFTVPKFIPNLLKVFHFISPFNL
ncbi:MAG: hypothetical protein [Myoviridae sp. ctThM1]|nr:MAG: hypothetical protein [Myoviridae sp. ctThM1]